MISKLPQWHLANKRVLVRADLNIPIKNGVILDDTRLRAIQPTIDLILQKGGSCIVMTHIDDPISWDPNLSTQHLVPWFKNNKYTIEFAHAPGKALRMNHDTNILLLENLRFFPGEINRDHAFAQELALLGDYYVNDAFGTLHRTDTSITLVPQLFSSDNRTIGLLVEKELQTLNQLRTNPKQPFVLILGGNKAATKIPLIESLFNHINSVLICPALAFTFAKALGKPVGKSLVDDTMLSTCKKIIEKSTKQNINIVLPIDYQITHEATKNSFEIINAQNMPSDGIGISIGPKTIALFKKEITHANTIFFNGAPGFIDKPETLEGIKQLLRIITQTSASTIISGGDSIAIAHKFNLLDRFTHVSTGGGSTLTYLGGKPLPGLTYF